MNATRLIGPAVLAVLSANGASAADDGAPSQRLLGSWACDTGACPDEEVEFSIVDGVATYNSWLHERPSASDGRWSMDGVTLRIECCAGMEFEYQVVRVTDTELVLRDADSSEEAVLSRIVLPEAGTTTGPEPE